MEMTLSGSPPEAEVHFDATAAVTELRFIENVPRGVNALRWPNAIEDVNGALRG
jgi:hypothetical protein